MASLDSIQRPAAGLPFKKEWMRSALDRFRDYSPDEGSGHYWNSEMNGATPPATPYWDTVKWTNISNDDDPIVAWRQGPLVGFSLHLEATATPGWGQVTAAGEPLPTAMRPDAAVKLAGRWSNGDPVMITVGTDGHIDATADDPITVGNNVVCSGWWTVTVA